jgi:hypothetical protein
MPARDERRNVEIEQKKIDYVAVEETISKIPRFRPE